MDTSFAFGTAFDGNDPPVLARLAATAEQAGFSMVMTGDSPVLYGDCFLGMSVIAANTSTCNVSSFVTNPRLRHPAVVASAMSTLASMSSGRAILGLSSGDSSVINLGIAPARQDDLETFVRDLRRFWGNAHHETHTDASNKLKWPAQPVPVYLAPGGPRGLRLAGRIADGVFVETGLLPETVEHALEQLDTGARQAGRRIEDIDVWWHVRASIGPSVASCTQEMRGSLAGIANRLLRFTAAGKFVPDELRPKLEALSAAYQMAHHRGLGAAGGNAALVDDPDLLGYLVERYALLGSPDDWVDKLRRLQRLGVTKVAIAAMMPDRDEFLRRFGSDVLPKVRAA